jgi:hypothetical protein
MRIRLNYGALNPGALQLLHNIPFFHCSVFFLSDLLNHFVRCGVFCESRKKIGQRPVTSVPDRIFRLIGAPSIGTIIKSDNLFIC